MTKRELIDRLQRAGDRTRALAASYVVEDLPPAILFTLQPFDNPEGSRGPAGTMKFLGGRFLSPSDLRLLPARRAGALLWVDGRVPVWVNLIVVRAHAAVTEIDVVFSRTLVEADPMRLPPDYGGLPGNDLVPFRIRGPGVPEGWRSVELDGRVRLRQKE